MRLDHDAREIAEWTIETTKTLSGWKIQLTPGGAWFSATSYTDTLPDSNGIITGTVGLLVRGPNYPPTGAGLSDDGLGAVVLETCTPRIFPADNPEVPIRSDQNIEVIR